MQAALAILCIGEKIRVQPGSRVYSLDERLCPKVKELKCYQHLSSSFTSRPLN